MRDKQTQLNPSDIWLAVFTIVAGWLVIFQSGLVR